MHTCMLFFFWGENCGRPYGLPTPKHFPVPYTLAFLCQRLNSWNFQLPHFPCFDQWEGNHPFLYKKQSLTRRNCPSFFPIIPAWNVDLKHRCTAAILQTWCCKHEDKGLYLRWKGRKLERDSVSDVSIRHHPSSGLSTSRRIFTWYAIHTHTYTYTHTQFLKRRDKKYKQKF